MSRKEIPTDPQHLSWLKESLSGKDDRFSGIDRTELHQLVFDAYDTLEGIDLWIINALLFEKLSLRDVEYILGIPKTTVARKRDQILQRLAEQLSQHEIVKDYLDENTEN
tara:strand:+ start:279 stop:608 length:330 start_codon:yes stop_codon:yes gene_type:complete